jgi:hypothetical protein
MTMVNETQAVLKKSQVKLAGPRRIGPGQPLAAARTAAAPRAQIVEQDDSHALIEIICPCGAKALLHCDFAPAPNAAGGGDNQ